MMRVRVDSFLEPSDFKRMSHTVAAEPKTTSKVKVVKSQLSVMTMNHNWMKRTTKEEQHIS